MNATEIIENYLAIADQYNTTPKAQRQSNEMIWDSTEIKTTKHFCYTIDLVPTYLNYFQDDNQIINTCADEAGTSVDKTNLQVMLVINDADVPNNPTHFKIVNMKAWRTLSKLFNDLSNLS